MLERTAVITLQFGVESIGLQLLRSALCLCLETSVVGGRGVRRVPSGNDWPSCSEQIMKLQHFAGAFLCLVAAVLVAAKVDNIIHEVRFAEVYRHWSASETEKSIYVNAGDMILARMNENPGTGYRWQLVTDEKDGFDQSLCQLQATSGFADGLYEPSTSTDGSDDKVVDGVSRPYVPPGAGEWPYPYPWGDRRFDIRCTKAGSTVLKLRYKRSWEERYSWESRLNVYVLANN